jgi:hypothetical protein
MKLSLPALGFALIFSVLPALPAAETKSTPPARTGNAAPSSALAGEYAGTWKAQNDSGGTLRIVLKSDGATAWSADASFTFEGAEITTKMKSVKVAEGKIEIVFGWEVQGTSAQSTLQGEWKGDVLAGKYDSTSAEGAAAGTWTVTRR